MCNPRQRVTPRRVWTRALGHLHRPGRMKFRVINPFYKLSPGLFLLSSSLWCEFGSSACVLTIVCVIRENHSWLARAVESVIHTLGSITADPSQSSGREEKGSQWKRENNHPSSSFCVDRPSIGAARQPACLDEQTIRAVVLQWATHAP